jgi:hypothetical protein
MTMALSAVQPKVPTRRALRFRSARRAGGEPPGPALVVIVSTGETIPASAVSRAVALSDGTPVGVVSLAHIHGSALGTQRPEPKEMGAHRAVVAGALASIERAGCAGWGQAGASRRPGRAIARVARERGARHVVIVVPARPRWRRVRDGEMIRELIRRVASGTTIETVSP